jgi:hypothetical protein
MPEDMKADENSHIDAVSYYTDDKYALWIDLRSTEDNGMHGSGLRLVNTKDGVQLAITRDTETKYTMHNYICGCRCHSQHPKQQTQRNHSINKK